MTPAAFPLEFYWDNMALAANLVKVALLVVRSSAPALNQLRLLTFFFSSAESEQHFQCCVAMQANLPQCYTEIREFTSCPGARVQFYNAFRDVVWRFSLGKDRGNDSDLNKLPPWFASNFVRWLIRSCSYCWNNINVRTAGTRCCLRKHPQLTSNNYPAVKII